MFNTPILDIVIGLVFIFLLYSLLATSIKEGIATALGLRSRMLKKGIVTGMLSCTPDTSRWDSRWRSLLLGAGSFLKEALYSILLIKPGPGNVKKKLGDYFYDHPLLKNYGSSGIYPNPSYLPTKNFSLILIETLKKDFVGKAESIARTLLAHADGKQSLEQLTNGLLNSSDADKIKELLRQYGLYYAAQGTDPASEPVLYADLLSRTGITKESCIIDKDTWEILQLHLRAGMYTIEDFARKLEDWFDDSMNRVSGWYKRQVQVILLLIGFIMALIFNVDTLEIAGKLSKDDKLRDQVVKSAIAYSQAAQNQPAPAPKVVTGKPAIAGDSIKKADSVITIPEVKEKFKQVDSMVDHDIRDINSILALGYGDFGRKDTLFHHTLKNKTWIGIFYITSTSGSAIDIGNCMDSLISFGAGVTRNKEAVDSMPSGVRNFAGLEKENKILADDLKKYRMDTSLVQYISRRRLTKDSVAVRDSLADARFYIYQVQEYPVHVKTAYVWYVLRTNKRKWLSFLILGLAVCLGAPFWFDILSKIINLRGSGKKEDGNDPPKKKDGSAPRDPITINVNTASGGQEAVG
ncbi:hypothetical protein ACX0G9_11105 [Flavitalea flava]